MLKKSFAIAVCCIAMSTLFAGCTHYTKDAASRLNSEIYSSHYSSVYSAPGNTTR